jgi:hypothetical protein
MTNWEYENIKIPLKSKHLIFLERENYHYIIIVNNKICILTRVNVSCDLVVLLFIGHYNESMK